MRITRSMTIQAQTSEYAASLAKQAAGNGFWDKRCIGCLSSTKIVEFAVADSYYASPLDAAADEVNWHMFLCGLCMKEDLWAGSKVLAIRPKVSIVKRHRCAFAEPCGNSTVMFINTSGGRQYLCITHVSIHANYTQVWAETGGPELKDMTEHTLMFYNDAIKPRLTGEKSARS